MVVRYVLVLSALLLTVALGGADDKKTGDKDKLQGEWVVDSASFGGNEAEALKGKKLVVKGDGWTAPTGGGFKFKLDAAKSPKHLDLTANRGPGEHTWPGIYKLDGDTFTFCQSQAAGGERPTEFQGAKGVALMVFKRAEKK